ncbi:hypothetical protein LTR94_030115, partial [Friedmanniomyces endolithicus]
MGSRMFDLFSAALTLAVLAAAAPAAPAAPATPTASPDARERMVCKRFLETGSLVKSYKTCKTNAEWERERANIRQNNDRSNSCRIAGEGGA